jgi:hypothetical protein
MSQRGFPRRWSRVGLDGQVTTGARPGWYADPWKVASQRWWDGSQWTAFVGPAPPTPGPPAIDIPAAHRGEERTFKWARAAVCAWGAIVLSELIVVIALAGRVRRDLDRFFSEIPTAQPGQQPSPSFAGLQRVSIALDLSQLLLIGVTVVFFVWQYHAARVAQGLGYPARTSPGFGVGSWFIPVINLWFPYWALCDCLPPDHALRSNALKAWLAYLGAGFCTPVAGITAMFSTVAAIIALAVAVAFTALAVALGSRLITAVNDDHRRAVPRALP